MTRETVRLCRTVTGYGYDGVTASRVTETIDVVIEWPEDKPAKVNEPYADYAPWQIATVLGKKIQEGGQG